VTVVVFFVALEFVLAAVRVREHPPVLHWACSNCVRHVVKFPGHEIAMAAPVVINITPVRVLGSLSLLCIVPECLFKSRDLGRVLSLLLLEDSFEQLDLLLLCLDQVCHFVVNLSEFLLSGTEFCMFDVELLDDVVLLVLHLLDVQFQLLFRPDVQTDVALQLN